MKKIILLIGVAFLFISNQSFSQCNWFAINNTGLSSDFNAVFFPSQWSRVLVGANGIIVKTDNEGYNWVQVPSNTSSNLNCVYFPTDSIGFAGGDNGTILKTIDRGNTWSVLYPSIFNHLYGMYFTTPTNGFVVGQSGEIATTMNAGSSWTTQIVGTSSLNSVFFINQNTGWVVGEFGSIFKTIDAGTTWVPQTGTHTGTNFAVQFVDSVTGFVVGQGGVIQKTSDGGATWVNQTTNIQNDLHSIAFHDYYYGYAVGTNGTILGTTDGGDTWTIIYGGINTNLNSIFIKYDTKYIAGAIGTLLMYAQDVVSSQPADQSACTGNYYISMSITFASPQVQYTGQWQMDSGSGWNNISINDTSHYNSTSATMDILHYNLSFNNRKYRFIYTTYCGTDTSNIAILHIRAPQAGSILNFLPEYCAIDTSYTLHGIPAQGYFNGPGIMNNIFNPSLVQGDSALITYQYADSTGCQSQISGTTHIFNIPIIVLDSLWNPACGSADGKIFVSANNGIPPYQYQWSNNSTSNVLLNVQAGIYIITVTDSHGCRNSDFKILDNANGPYFEIISSSTNCSNSCDGNATVNIFQGIPPYSYHWTNGQTTATDTALCKGQYFVTITDSLGCKRFSDFTIGYLQEAAIINCSVYSQSGPILGNLVVHLFTDSSGIIIEEKNILIDYLYEGMFTISEIPSGNYYLQIEPDHNANPLLATSFYRMTGSTYLWDSASVISVSCGAYQYTSVQMVNLYDNGTGSGFISGYIHQAGGFGKHGKGIYVSSDKKLTGEPVPGAEIYVELEPDDEPIANTQTDSSGYFEVTGLADGQYSMNVQIPGVNMDSTYTLNISGNDTTFTNINFFVDTSGLAIIDSVHYSVGEIGKDIASISLYPNPFNESFTFEFEITGESDVKIDIFDLSGKCVRTIINEKRSMGKHIVKLNTNYMEIAEGAYFIRCRVNNSYFIKKLIKM